jgi:hypothetical protein
VTYAVKVIEKAANKRKARPQLQSAWADTGPAADPAAASGPTTWPSSWSMAVAAGPSRAAAGPACMHTYMYKTLLAAYSPPARTHHSRQGRAPPAAIDSHRALLPLNANVPNLLLTAEVIKEVAVMRLLADHPCAVQLHQVRAQGAWPPRGGVLQGKTASLFVCLRCALPRLQ